MDREIRVARCFIAWSLRNIRQDVNDKFVKKLANVTIPQGYYTFTDLQDFLSKHKVTIQKLASSHVTLQSEEDLNLKSFGPPLGFDENKAITKNTMYTSSTSAAFTNRLKDIHVHCSMVDFTRNYSYNSSGLYYASTLLLVLSIDTTQLLNGNITYYNMDLVRVPCRNFNGQDIEFVVESGGHVDDYEIYLTLEIH